MQKINIKTCLRQQKFSHISRNFIYQEKSAEAAKPEEGAGKPKPRPLDTTNPYDTAADYQAKGGKLVEAKKPPKMAKTPPLKPNYLNCEVSIRKSGEQVNPEIATAGDKATDIFTKFTQIGFHAPLGIETEKESKERTKDAVDCIERNQQVKRFGLR